MFTITYRFTILPQQNEAFEESWKEVTTLIYRHCGSLGSRLYKISENSYLGIAQWPDRETWNSSNLEGFDPHGWREKMRNCCESTETLDGLVLIHDLWADKPFG